MKKILSQRIVKQTPTEEAPLMAFIANCGVSTKGNRYDRSYLVKNDNKLYKRTEIDDFIYSSNNLDVGSIGLNDYGTAVISDVYEIFSINNLGIPSVINDIIQQPYNMNQIIKYRQGCLYGQYRINPTDFLNVSVNIPCIEEQIKIADFFKYFDQKIAQQTKLIDDLKKYKRGLISSIWKQKWPIKKLSMLLEFQNGINASSDKYGSGIKYVMKDIYRANKSRNRKADMIPLEENIFDGVLFCGVCGRKLTRHSAVTPYVDGRIERVESFSCLDSSNSKVESCKESNRITKSALTSILVPALRMEFAVYLEKPKKYAEYGKLLVEEAGKRYDKQLRDLELEIERIHESESNAYMNYRTGSLKQSAYVEMKMKNVDRKASIEKQIEEVTACKGNLSKVSEKFAKAIRALLKMKSGNELSKDLIEALIERINLYPGKRIEIVYRYSDELLKGVK